jgi:thiol-disulfide isomerase/thioredoxin
MDFRILLAISILLILSVTTYGSLQLGGSRDGEKTIVLYYAPWCGNCTEMMPEWSKFAKKHQSDKNIKVKAVNSDKNPAKIKEAKVDRFPTIILYDKGKQRVFNSERRAEAFEAFVNSD